MRQIRTISENYRPTKTPKHGLSYCPCMSERRLYVQRLQWPCVHKSPTDVFFGDYYLALVTQNLQLRWQPSSRWRPWYLHCISNEDILGTTCTVLPGLGVTVDSVAISLRITWWHCGIRIDYLQADYDIFSMKHHDFVTTNDVIQHFLPSHSAKGHLFNYFIF